MTTAVSESIFRNLPYTFMLLAGDAPDLTDPNVRQFLWHNIWWIASAAGTLLTMGWVVGRFVFTNLLKETQFRLSAYEKDLKAANERLDTVSRLSDGRRREEEIEQGVRVEKQKSRMQTIGVALQSLLLVLMGFSIYLQTHWTPVSANAIEQLINPKWRQSSNGPEQGPSTPNPSADQNRTQPHSKSSTQSRSKQKPSPSTPPNVLPKSTTPE